MRIQQKQLADNFALIPDVHPVLQRIYALRNITDSKQLDKTFKSMLPFDSLKGIDKACQRLAKALQAQQNILIVGDFDADGATSTALAVSALRVFGAQNVSYLVPNRFAYGYGLSPEIVNVAKQAAPDLIITVDNGIASIDGVNRANELGIDVLVTDHHLPGEELPKACAIVNPNQPGCDFSSKSIAGVGVIFYLMLALRRHLDNSGWFTTREEPVPNMGQFLDLVALGTVADVVALDQNNRILVEQGLVRIRQKKVRPGISALIEVARRQVTSLQAADLGFALGPRLNAAGRLDDMSLGIECLLSADLNKARQLAEQLDDLNQERRRIEADMKDQARELLDKLTVNQNSELPLGVCLFDESWHQGVIGILAGRLKDRHHRPTIIFSPGDGGELKGSARSINGLNIRDVLAAIDKDYPDLIIKFGGHAMAAGLSIKQSKFTDFQQAFVREVGRHIDMSMCSGDLYSDFSLTADDLNLELATILRESGPWGSYFPEPKFDNLFEIIDQRIVGQNHLKLTLALASGSAPIDAIFFNVDLDKWPNFRCKHIHALYKLDINTYQGVSKLQLMIESIIVQEELVPA